MLELVCAVFILFGGCCSNVYTLEIIINQARKSGNLITFVQFLFVASEGLISNLEWRPCGSGSSSSGEIDGKDKANDKKKKINGRSSFSILPRLKPRKIPLYRWAIMVLLFFVTSILNNHALGYRIPMPLHIIFRSSSLVVSMIMGYIVSRKTYSWGQIFGTLLVTVGVLQTTMASSNSAAAAANDINAEVYDVHYEWTMGITTLILAVVVACFLGQYQQMTYAKYGKHWREGLFYTHFLALPAFTVFYEDISAQFDAYNASPPFPFSQLVVLSSSGISSVDSIVVPSLKASLQFLSELQIPSLWVFLLVNTITQYICISSVYKISSITSSVTLNLLLSIRKFISLLISIYMFGNDFTAGHWVGTAAVFLGTLIYTASPSSSFAVSSSARNSEKAKKE